MYPTPINPTPHNTHIHTSNHTHTHPPREIPPAAPRPVLHCQHPRLGLAPPLRALGHDAVGVERCKCVYTYMYTYLYIYGVSIRIRHPDPDRRPSSPPPPPKKKTHTQDTPQDTHQTRTPRPAAPSTPPPFGSAAPPPPPPPPAAAAPRRLAPFVFVCIYCHWAWSSRCRPTPFCGHNTRTRTPKPILKIPNK